MILYTALMIRESEYQQDIHCRSTGVRHAYLAASPVFSLLCALSLERKESVLMIPHSEIFDQPTSAVCSGSSFLNTAVALWHWSSPSLCLYSVCCLGIYQILDMR
jgi:hypothetical protein